MSNSTTTQSVENAQRTMVPAVKVCGMREIENIAALCRLPVDFMGLIFYPKSKRYVADAADFDLVEMIRLTSEAGIKRVGVFVNESMDTLRKFTTEYQLDIVQLHGEEPAAYCRELHESGFKIWKVFSVGPAFDFTKLVDYEGFCDAFLFDTKGVARGGNGFTFDWEVLKDYSSKTPLVLSGGIGPEMGGRILDISLPQLFAIDINSRFESAPALKDIERIAQFLKEFKTQIT
ncbi:MAG: phosphoribosylanthranilate isomerase [Bacteroidota bacterium]